MRKGHFGLMTTAAALAVSLPLAVSAQQTPPAGVTPPPAERMERGPAAPDARSPATPPSGSAAQSSRATTGAEMASAINSDDLIGKKVKNSANETIGEIDALLVSKDARVVGVVLDVGGFLGVGGKKVVIPMEQLSVAGKDDVRLPTGSKEQLQQAPAYEKPRG